MKNTKISTALALIATISTSLTAQTPRCYDENGNPISCGVIKGSARVVKGAGESALNILTFGEHAKRKEEDRRRDEETEEEETKKKKNVSVTKEPQEKITNPKK